LHYNIILNFLSLVELRSSFVVWIVLAVVTVASEVSGCWLSLVELRSSFVVEWIVWLVVSVKSVVIAGGPLQASSIPWNMC
jgi:hypothetical protein